MNDFRINARWLEGELDYPEETATFAEIVVRVASALVTKIYDPTDKEVLDGARLPAVLLARGIAENWWPLLYEPQKRLGDFSFEARHRLDAFTHGYVFPPLGLWSGGDTVMAGLFRPDTRFQQQQFILPEQHEPWLVPRTEVKSALRIFITETISKLGSLNDALRQACDRVFASEADQAEKEWCVNAGRLGIDPYDGDAPDLERIRGNLSEELFADLCEAAEPDELSPVANWVREASQRLRNAPAITTRGFGAAPRPDFGRRPYTEGYDAGRLLRTRMGLSEAPQRGPRCAARRGGNERPGNAPRWCRRNRGPRTPRRWRDADGGYRQILSATALPALPFHLPCMALAREHGGGDDGQHMAAAGQPSVRGRTSRARRLASRSCGQFRAYGRRYRSPGRRTRLPGNRDHSTSAEPQRPSSGRTSSRLI